MEWDIFISYAHRDDIKVSESTWVAHFKEDLEEEVSRCLGREVKAFRDLRNAPSNARVREVCDEAAKATVYLGLTSPSYLASEYTKAELEAFLGTGSDGLLFFAEVFPLSAQAYPLQIGDKLRAKMHVADSTNGAVMTISRAFQSGAYQARVAKLGQDIARELSKRAPITSAPSAGRMVLLADAPGLSAEVETVASHLRQFGVSVLLAPPVGQDVRAFKKTFDDLASKADILVQLLAMDGGQMADGFPGAPGYQFDAASKMGLEILQWRSPATFPAKANGAHRQLLEGHQVIVSSLNAFIGEVRSRLRPTPAVPSPASPGSSPAPGDEACRVFISHDLADERVAREILRACVQRDLPVVGSLFPGNERPNEFLERQYRAASRIVLLYGEAQEGWIDAQLDIYTRARALEGSQPELLVVCLGPPPSKELLSHVPGLKRQDHTAGWSVNQIVASIAANGAGAGGGGHVTH